MRQRIVEELPHRAHGQIPCVIYLQQYCLFASYDGNRVEGDPPTGRMHPDAQVEQGETGAEPPYIRVSKMAQEQAGRALDGQSLRHA